MPISDSTSGQQSPGRLLSPFRATEAEWQAYYYYFRESSLSIGGSIDVAFWHDTVLRYAQTEPSIRYAVFAVGSFSRHIEIQPVIDYRSCSCQHCRPALKYYNRAISSLNDHIQTENSHRILLLACVLFICIEEIQGNVQNALPLIRQGCSMLRQHRESSIHEVDDDENNLMTLLAEMFGRLCLMSNFFGHPMEEPEGPSKGNETKPVLEARCQLYHIMNDGINFTRQAANVKWVPYMAPVEMDHLRQWQDRLSDRLNRWYADFFTLSTKAPSQNAHGKMDKKVQEKTLMNLRAYYLVSKIWVSTGLTCSEAAYEEHLELFKSIVDHASLGTHDQTRFTFEMGLALPLYFTATKCRNPSIRRHSVALLSHLPRRQGLWNRAESVAVANRVIDLEEESTPRIHFTDINIEPLLLEDNQLRVPVTYTWRTGNPIEPWSSKTESLVVADGASGDRSYEQSLLEGERSGSPTQVQREASSVIAESLK
ncbi:MAG: hypothetical protein Q9227_005327 [Pyrenula ochraceoflavens]